MLSRAITSLVIIFSLTGHASNYEHESMKTSKIFQKEFEILEKKIAEETGPTQAISYLQDRRADRARDRGQDLMLATILSSSEYAVSNRPLVNNLLDTMRIGHNRQLLETVKYIGPETALTDKSKQFLEMYTGVVNSRFYSFNKEYRENARLYIDGSQTVNAYSFTGYPQTLYYLGLVEALTPQELLGVVGHELGHAVSKHVDSKIEMYAYLILGGYYMFNDSSEINSKGVLEENKLLESFQANISQMASVNPSEIESQKGLSHFEKSAVMLLSQHAGEFGNQNYTENMKVFLSSISELASTIYAKTLRDGSFSELQNLVLSLESVIIDSERMNSRLSASINRNLGQGVVKTKMRQLFSSVNAFYEQMYFGLMSLSRSQERTADNYGLLIAGKEATLGLEAKFMSGKLANVEEEMAQRKVIEQDQAKDPARHKAELNSWYRSHPTPLRRLENAEKFVQSAQYKLLTIDYFKSFADYLDMYNFYSEVADQSIQLKDQQKAANKEYKTAVENINKVIAYVKGETESLPEGVKIEGDLKDPAVVANFIKEIKLSKREMSIENDRRRISVDSYQKEYAKMLPDLERLYKRYQRLVSGELIRLSKSQSASDFSETVRLMSEILLDWGVQHEFIPLEEISSPKNLGGIIARLEKTKPKEAALLLETMTAVFESTEQQREEMSEKKVEIAANKTTNLPKAKLLEARAKSCKLIF